MLRAVMVVGLAAAVAAPDARAVSPVRLKDIATLAGVSPTPLIGYGLVVGLSKTGDKRQTLFTTQTIASMLERFGVAVPGGEIKIENTAAVVVTAELPPFTRAGGRIDVTASSIGDARSLQGGTLIATALRGPDGSIHVLAQGPLSIGGFGGGGGDNSVQVNHLTVGRVPAGGLVQSAPAVALTGRAARLLLTLNDADFITAQRTADAISRELGPGAASALDAGTVAVTVPAEYQDAVPALMARLEPLTIEVDRPARVVINERTGTVVIGADVRIGPAAVAHGNLSVRITTTYDVSQPAPMSRGETAIVPRQDVDVTQQSSKLVTLEAGVTLETVVKALNALGATPRDIIAIMQALKAAGALRAELVSM
jgi:flagellar P-ring protein precursor FlgI